MQLTRPESHTTVYVEFIKYDAPKKRCCGSHLSSALRRKGCAAVRGNSVCVIRSSSLFLSSSHRHAGIQRISAVDHAFFFFGYPDLRHGLLEKRE